MEPATTLSTQKLNGYNPVFSFEKSIPDEEFERDAINTTEMDKKENLFPVSVFPSPIQKIIYSTNKSLNFSIDYIGSSLLYSMSVAIGTTHNVEVKKGFIQFCVIYLVMVGPRGTGKSEPLSFAVSPIRDRDKITYREFESKLAEYLKIVNLTKKEREELLLEEVIKPIWQKFLLSDFTPEALVFIMKNNIRGVGIYADELASWFKNFNRYNKGSEMEMWLSIWSGKPITQDRKSGDPIYISNPFASVAGTIQNGLLNELASDRTNNGFLDRLLFVIPSNIKKPYWNDNELEPGIAESWNSILGEVLNIPIQLDEFSCPRPETLKFTSEAKKILFKWQQSNADECNSVSGDIISGIYSKLEMYAVRIALILEIMFWACNESDKTSISTRSIEGALHLVEYFKKSALKVHSIISKADPLSELPLDKQELYNVLPDVFKTKDGVAVASSLGIPERTFKRFIVDQKELFANTTRGEYEKRF